MAARAAMDVERNVLRPRQMENRPPFRERPVLIQPCIFRTDASAQTESAAAVYFFVAGAEPVVGFAPPFLARFSGRETGIKYPPTPLIEMFFSISLSPYFANVTSVLLGTSSGMSASNRTECEPDVAAHSNRSSS